MKKQIFYLIAIITLIAASCTKDTGGENPTPVSSDTITLKGDITTNMTLDANKKYLLDGYVYVMSGATLNIPAGTVIMGKSTTKGTLIITRGAKINAVGTTSKPVIFTSEKAPGNRATGDWGGVILMGKAPINPTGGSAKIEGGLTPTVSGQEAIYNTYGGTDAADNSGTMKYVRIEFAGIAYATDSEINGLTLGGVGSGTTLSYIQVYKSGDDAYEWFGGTVNADHLVAYGTWDDDFDTDFGYSGTVQYGLGVRLPAVADKSGSNGFESDNDGNGSTSSPKTAAKFKNMTIVGPLAYPGQTAASINQNYQHGAQIRRNSAMSLTNSIIMGFPLAGVYIDDTKGTPTSANFTSGALAVSNNVIVGPVPFKAEASSILSKLNTDNKASADASYYTSILSNPYSSTLSFLPKAGSVALNYNGQAYVGAFDTSNDWTSGWCTWNAETNKY